MKSTLRQRVQSSLGEALWELGATMRWSWAMRLGWHMVSTSVKAQAENVTRPFDQRDYDA